MTPLYLASATIRPGITAYNPSGGPVREWKLKDITHWFNIGMYRMSVAEQLGWTEYKWVDIKANFIMRGMQNIQGGNVITLTTLDPDPQQAMDILEAATVAFNEYARADSVSSQIGLTRSGLMIQIAALQNQQGLLQSKRAKLDLDIAVAKSESIQVETQMRLIDLEIERQTIAKDLYQRHLHTQAAESLKPGASEKESLKARSVFSAQRVVQ